MSCLLRSAFVTWGNRVSPFVSPNELSRLLHSKDFGVSKFQLSLCALCNNLAAQSKGEQVNTVTLFFREKQITFLTYFVTLLKRNYLSRILVSGRNAYVIMLSRSKNKFAYKYNRMETCQLKIIANSNWLSSSSLFQFIVLNFHFFPWDDD